RKRLLGGGADHGVRVWQISEAATETTDPLLHSKLAHEGTILNLVFSSDGQTLLSSADDRTVKLWDAAQMKERLLLEKQPDWPPALAFIADKTVIVGRLDGSLGLYDLATGKLTASVQPGSNQPNDADNSSPKNVKLAGASSIVGQSAE